MNLEDLIYQQNPEWSSNEQADDKKGWPKRQAYFECLAWQDKRPIVALTGLRRTGKSTILRQIKTKLPSERTLYFSFERSQVKFHPDSLRQILNWYFEVFLKTSPQSLQSKVFIFLDEVQYIPYWQDVVKTYYDQSELIKFFVSGSTSLFIKKKALESLAGRIVEIIVPPLSFNEFLEFKGLDLNLETVFPVRREYVNGLFEDFLRFGQFPEIVRDNYSLEQSLAYLSSIEEKIVEQDLPKSYPIKRIDILRLIFDFLKRNDGAIVELSNLAPDLGVDAKTVGKYLDYLGKAFLVGVCLNETKKPIRATRTGKKVYMTSANFFQSEMPSKVENYVFNFLREKGETKFYRFKDFEVDFVLAGPVGKIPIEVKYRDKIEERDYHNVIKLGKQWNSSKVILVSKNIKASRQEEGLTVETVPVSLLESAFQLE